MFNKISQKELININFDIVPSPNQTQLKNLTINSQSVEGNVHLKHNNLDDVLETLDM